MDDKLTREFLDEMLSAFERLEAQNLAVLQFLKAQKKGADKLAPYLEQAEKTSGVKWMATRARLNHLLDAAAREAEQAAEKSTESQKIDKNEKNSESEKAKSSKEPEGTQVQESEDKSETRAAEPVAQTSEVSSGDKPDTGDSTVVNQADAKPSSEEPVKHTTENAA